MKHSIDLADAFQKDDNYCHFLGGSNKQKKTVATIKVAGEIQMNRWTKLLIPTRRTSRTKIDPCVFMVFISLTVLVTYFVTALHFQRTTK